MARYIIGTIYLLMGLTIKLIPADSQFRLINALAWLPFALGGVFLVLPKPKPLAAHAEKYHLIIWRVYLVIRAAVGAYLFFMGMMFLTSSYFDETKNQVSSHVFGIFLGLFAFIPGSWLLWTSSRAWNKRPPV